MRYSFNPAVAQIVGTDAATIFDCIGFWVDTNCANDRNYVDGHYWTFNSAKAYHKLFFYISPKKIQRALLALEEAGLILSGEYNQSSYDRTKWYTLTDKGEAIYHDKNDGVKMSKWNGQNCPHEWTDLSSRVDENVQPIPVSIHTDINTDKKESDKSDSMSHSESVTLQVKEIIRFWNEMAKRKGISEVSRLSPESNRCKWLKTRIAEYGIDAVLEAIGNVGASDYLPNQHWFDFEWFVRPNNFPKVLEGKYGKAKKAMSKPDPEPESKTEPIIDREAEKERNKVDQMSDEEYEEYFRTAFGGE